MIECPRCYDKNSDFAPYCKICGHGLPSGDCHKPKQGTIDESEFYMVCPNCGNYPLVLVGELTLALKCKNAKAYCQKCLYEEKL